MFLYIYTVHIQFNSIQCVLFAIYIICGIFSITAEAAIAIIIIIIL